MRKAICFIVCAMLVGACLAVEMVTKYDLVDFDTVIVTTNGNQSSTYKERIDGHPVYLSIAVSGTTPTTAVHIVTSAGTGSSVAGEKVLYSGTLSANYNTNVVIAHYLYQDTVYCYVTNASANTTTTRVSIINER